MSQAQTDSSQQNDFSSLARYLSEQSQLQEFVESVSLVASSIFGLFSSRSLSDTATQLLSTSTAGDVSKNILYTLHKRLNCQEFLAYLDSAGPNAFHSISPDFFNPITKHFGRSQSIENYSKVLFSLTRIYGAQHSFYRNFFGIIRDCEETRLLISYIKKWDFSKLTENLEQTIMRVIICSLDRMVNSQQYDEFVNMLPDYEAVIGEGQNPEFSHQFNKLAFHLLLSMALKRNTSKLREVLPLLVRSKADLTLITLNKMIDALNKNCLELDLVELVIEGIERRQLSYNIITYNCYMESYCMTGHFEKARGIVGQILASGLHPDSYTIAIYIKGCKYFKSGDVFSAQKEIFDCYVNSTCRDKIVINSLIDQCISSNDDEMTAKIFDQMRNGSLGIDPDNVTYNIMLKFAVKNRDIDMASSLINDMAAKTFRPNLSTYNSLLNLCLKLQRHDSAVFFYQKMKEMQAVPDSFTYSIMLNGAKTHSYDIKLINTILEDVRASLDGSNTRLDEVVFNTILEILFTYDLLDQFDFFHSEMKRQKIPESSFTFSVVLKKLSKMEDFDKISAVFDELLEKKIAVSDFNYGFILDYFAKAKRMDWAYAIYRKLRDNNVELSSIIFTTMVKGFINVGDYDKALQCFNEIKHLTEQPGMIITYNCALDVLVHQEKIDEALVLLDQIQKLFKADLISYSTIIKGLCKANKRTQAFQLIKQMIDSKIEYDVSIMNLFLESCASSDDHKIGMSSFEYLHKRKVAFNEITMGIMVKIYGAQFKLKSAFGLLEVFSEINLKPSLIFFTNLIHVSFFNKKPAKAELAFTLMKKEGIKGDKLMYSKLIEGLLRFKQAERVPVYLQAAIDDNCGLKNELIDQLFEIYEDESVTCELIERVRENGQVVQQTNDSKNKLKNTYHQTNTQNFKNQIWQKNREKQEAERRQQVKEEECRVVENPNRKTFGNVSGKVEQKFEKPAEGAPFKQVQAPRQAGGFGPKQPMVLHNFRMNKKQENA